jgi:hypothetical protein
VEGNLLSLNFAVLDIDFVTNEHYWNVLTNTSQVLVPLRNIRVSDSSAHIEHDDSAVTTNVVTISKSSELILTCSIPNIESDLSSASEEGHRMYLNTESSDVLLFELTG